jgi:hypothetical protein
MDTKIPIPESDHLVPALLSPCSTFTQQPPTDPAKGPDSNEMLCGGSLTGLLIWLLAWQHVECPVFRDACPLDHPLEHRQQQGDEPQKHQLCITQRQRQRVKVCAVNIFILSGIIEERKGRWRFRTRLIGLVIADLEKDFFSRTRRRTAYHYILRRRKGV